MSREPNDVKDSAMQSCRGLHAPNKLVPPREREKTSKKTSKIGAGPAKGRV